MNQTTSAINIKYVVIAVLASFAWIAGVAVYFYSSKELSPGPTVPAPPEIKQTKHVDGGLFEQDFELRLAFDDGSKLSGIATAKCVGTELAWESGEVLAELLTDQTGVLWVSVDTSGNDYKKEWTSTQTEIGNEITLAVRFKIYRNNNK